MALRTAWIFKLYCVLLGYWTAIGPLFDPEDQKFSRPEHKPSGQVPQLDFLFLYQKDIAHHSTSSRKCWGLFNDFIIPFSKQARNNHGYSPALSSTFPYSSRKAAGVSGVGSLVYSYGYCHNRGISSYFNWKDSKTSSTPEGCL